MKTINIQAAKTHLSRIVDEVVQGEEIVLAKAGKPLVRLVPYVSPRKPRTPGILADKGWEAADCWATGESAVIASVADPEFHGAAEELPPGPKG